MENRNYHPVGPTISLSHKYTPLSTFAYTLNTATAHSCTIHLPWRKQKLIYVLRVFLILYSKLQVIVGATASYLICRAWYDYEEKKMKTKRWHVGPVIRSKQHLTYFQNLNHRDFKLLSYLVSIIRLKGSGDSIIFTSGPSVCGSNGTHRPNTCRDSRHLVQNLGRSM